MLHFSRMKRLALMPLFSLFLLTAFRTVSRWIHPLEPIGKHYQRLAAISAEPNSARAWMDTIQFPWTEYSKGALSASLMRPYYLTAEDEAKLPKLVRFPANSSDQTRAELDYLLDLQSKRTQKEIDRAEYIANFGSSPTIINPLDSEFKENRKQLFYMATPVIGQWYNDENFPATTQLLMNCIQDIRVTEFRLKRYFKRARPYHLEPRLRPLARMTSPSFASGHSLWSFTEAYIFSEIIPAKREEFLKMAEEVRWSRELMGIHYPSDNEASRVIGWYLLEDWYKNPAFVVDLEKAKMEWASRRK
jgi:acid phosphatase (class A)